MAGHNDRDGIAVIRHPHGTKSLWPSNRAGDIGISPRLTVRNPEQCPPAVQLKCSPTEIKRKTEPTAASSEILLKFAYIAGHLSILALEAYALSLSLAPDRLLPRQSRLEFQCH